MSKPSVLKKYIIEYELDYVHRVQVGILAKSEGVALKKAQAAFDDATIWDDTADMPLLYDDYEETQDNTLMFEVVEEVDSWPEADASVKIVRRRNAAEKAFGVMLEALEIILEHHDTGSIGLDSWQPCRDAVAQARAIESKSPMKTCLGDQIELIWHVDDVLGLRPDLTREQAVTVLQKVQQHHDASIGVNWETLEFWADNLFGTASAGSS